MLRLSLVASLLVCVVALPPVAACQISRIDDDNDDDDGGEGEGEGEQEVPQGPENNEAACTDGGDNDGDTFVDCDDFDCDEVPSCIQLETECSDGADNDGDTFADCFDFDCDASPDCAEDCSDGEDNDGDGRTDCEDGTCNGRAGGERDPACDLGAVAIQAVQSGEISGSVVVELQNVFITGAKVAESGNVNLFVQEPEGETIDGITYPQFAGVGVFIPEAVAATLPAVADLEVGDCISVSGEVDEFNDGTQIANVTALALAEECGTAPAPAVVALEDIARDADPATADDQPGALAEAYECVLVTVEGVTAAEDAEDGAFLISDGDDNTLLVNDFLLDAPPEVSDGTAFASITGVLSQFIGFQLLPRSAGEIVAD